MYWRDAAAVIRCNEANAQSAALTAARTADVLRLRETGRPNTRVLLRESPQADEHQSHPPARESGGGGGPRSVAVL